MHGGGSPMHFAALRGDVGMLKELALHTHPNPNANPNPNPKPSPNPHPHPNPNPNPNPKPPVVTLTLTLTLTRSWRGTAYPSTSATRPPASCPRRSSQPPTMARMHSRRSRVCSLRRSRWLRRRA
jgi:hypothetical protein